VGLYKRKVKAGTTWCIQYFAHGKRVREAVGPSKRQAELVLSKRKADLREGKFFDTQKEKPLAFSALAERYLREHAALHRKPRSYARYVASTKVLIGYFGDKIAGTIRPEHVHAFLSYRKERGKANATVNGELTVLSSIFTWGVRLKLTRHHPVKGTPRFRVNGKDRWLTTEEIPVLLRALRADIRDAAIVALGTGMRASEVVSLDREHVNLSQGVAILEDTKNGDRRTVPLPPEVVSTLQQRPVPLRVYFPRLTYKRLSERFSYAADKAGFPDVTFHTLRHSFASYAVMAGVDLYTLAKILGHRNLSMVQRYAHLAPSHLQSATNRAASAIFAADMPHQVPHATGSAA